MQLRAATDQDSAAVKLVVFSVLAEYGLKPDSASTDKDLDNLEAYYSRSGGYFGVIEAGDRIIATIGLHRENATTCELRKMYCLPGFRGKGLGSLLLEFALAKAKKMGFSRVILETASPLKEAIGLYRKYGFTEFKPEHLSARCDQAYELFL